LSMTQGRTGFAVFDKPSKKRFRNFDFAASGCRKPRRDLSRRG
jgi:hypothetical protein